MIIKPAMMQATVQRTQDMSSIKHQEDNKAFMAQSAAQSVVNKDTLHKAQDVNKKDNADYHEQKHDAKEKGKNEYFSQNNKKNNEDSRDEDDGRVILKKRRADFDLRV